MDVTYGRGLPQDCVDVTYGRGLPQDCMDVTYVTCDLALAPQGDCPRTMWISLMEDLALLGVSKPALASACAGAACQPRRAHMRKAWLAGRKLCGCAECAQLYLQTLRAPRYCVACRHGRCCAAWMHQPI